MIAKDKVIQRIEKQIATCKQEDSDWISLTVETGKTILALLKEKEPRKAIRAEDMDSPAGIVFYVCPACKIMIDYRDKFCCHCGQAISWEE